MTAGRTQAADHLVVAGSAVVLVAGFLDWFTFTGAVAANAFDFTLTGSVPWLLLVSAGAITFVAINAPGPLSGCREAVAVLTIAAGGAVLIGVRTVVGAEAGDVVPTPHPADDVTLDRAVGLWLALLGAVLAAGAAAVNVRRRCRPSTPLPRSG